MNLPASRRCGAAVGFIRKHKFLGRDGVVLALTLVALARPAAAQEFRLQDVKSIATEPADSIKPLTVLFTDHAEGAASNPSTGLIKFEDWARTRPEQKQLLSPYPGYAEPKVSRTIAGVTRTRVEKLTMYVAEARFKLNRAPSTDDLSRFVTLSFVQNVDPAIKHHLITPEQITPLTNPKFAYDLNPRRAWCTGTQVICLRSHYQLEGKLPLAVHLANKLRDPEKKIADYLEFESELAARTPDQLDQVTLKQLTGLDTPILGALVQTTFYVNQVLQFGKFIAVFQRDAADPDRAVVTAYMALAVESKVLNTKKEYAKVPVLRNLVPVQVLMGKSSFNTGNSISSGLPNYARSRIKAVAQSLNAG